MPKVVASIEARMNSSRLPGKMLKDIEGQPALTRLVRRLQCCKTLDGIVLATTTSSQDEALEQCAQQESIKVYRGSEENVLNRVVEAHRFMESDIIVEITGDNILLDPEIIDMGVSTFLENDCDVVTNARKTSYPMGIDIQVFPFKLLEEVDAQIKDPAIQEHVSLYFYENPDKYKIIHLLAPARWHAPEYRFQLDYPQDLEFIKEIYKYLEPKFKDAFGIEEIMSLLKEKPELVKINIDCEERAPR